MSARFGFTEQVWMCNEAIIEVVTLTGTYFWNGGNEEYLFFSSIDKISEGFKIRRGSMMKDVLTILEDASYKRGTDEVYDNFGLDGLEFIDE